MNEQDVAHHSLTIRQANALYQGGVQKVFRANAKQGNNTLTAVFTGHGPHARDYKRVTLLEFGQSFETVFVELQITDSTLTQQPKFAAKVY